VATETALNHPWGTGIAPLHQTLDGMIGKGEFTDEAVGSPRRGSVQGRRRRLVGWKLLGQAFYLHGRLTDMRQQFERATPSEAHGERHSLASGGGGGEIRASGWKSRS
jgi:hypothetical protein